MPSASIIYAEFSSCRDKRDYVTAAAATDSDLPGRVSHSHRIRISLSLLPHVGLSFIYDRQLSSMPRNGN